MKDIPNYEGIYAVTPEGNIYNYRTGSLMKLQKDKDGYLLVSLTKNKLSKSFRVHRLVALLYIGNPNNFDEVNHIDCNKNNNHPSNLEWCTRLQNMRHASKLNKLGSNSKGHAPRKLSLEDETALKLLYNSSNLTMKEIGEIYGISSSTVCKIMKR